ncbi:hypothetical protein OAD50_04265 [Vicingaceae bacterium]|nr:hypothetical protein [Vicingaceae bacterium]
MRFKNSIILILSPNAWGDMHISKHHYAMALSKLGNDVYFLNPPSLGAALMRFTKITENLTIIDYRPLYRGREVLPNFIFQFLIWLQVKFIQLRIGKKVDVLWSFTTSIFHKLNWFNSDFKIFHPVDQLNSEIAVSIGKNANIIFTCSDYIMEELELLDKPKLLVSHGVAPSFIDFRFKNWTLRNSIDVCYVGNLFIQNLDRDQLMQTIQKHVNHKFHFIGAINPDDCNISAWLTDESIAFVNFLKKSVNVVCHGVIPSDRIPFIVKDMDAFLVCYKSDENNAISNSHKILEYLSTGRVVISTFVEHYKKSVLIEMLSSGSPKKYVSLYSDVMRDISNYNSIHKQELRMKCARDNSYKSNVCKMESYIDSMQLIG